jgi:hypothetical protein
MNVLYFLAVCFFVSTLGPPRAIAGDHPASALPLSGSDLALQFAHELADGAKAVSLEVPVPRSPYDNNPFSLVRSADDIALEERDGFVISHDKKWIAFAVPEDSHVPALWIARADGTEAREIVHLARTNATLQDGSAGVIPSESLFSLAFSADDRSLYFQTDGWATSLALYSVNVKDGSVRFVVDANGYFVVDACRKRSLVGNLIAYRHSYVELQSAVDWYYLLAPSGRELGAIGPGPEYVERFLSKECGAPKPAPVPPQLLRRPGCDGMLLRYEPRRFLDGSVLPRFYWVRKEDAFRAFERLDVEARGLPLDVADAEASLAERCKR